MAQILASNNKMTLSPEDRADTKERIRAMGLKRPRVVGEPESRNVMDV